MRFQKSTRTCLVVFICLIMVSGCRTFTKQSANQLDNPDQRFSLKDSPAQKRTPRTLNDLTGSSRKQPPASPSFGPFGPSGDAPQFSPGAIGIDDVGLNESTVHVEAAMGVEDLENDAQQQLPAIIESAVHPFSEIAPPITISDQFAGASKPAEPNQPITSPVRTVSYQEQVQEAQQPSQTLPKTVAPPIVVSQPTNQTPPPRVAQQQVVVSQPQPRQQQQAAPVQTQSQTQPVQQVQTPPVQTRQISEPAPMMKIVAEPNAGSPGSRSASTTDHLFADLDRKKQPPKGDVVIVVEDQSQPVAAIPSTVPMQQNSGQMVQHQEPATIDLEGNNQSGAVASLSDTIAVAGEQPEMIQLTWDEQLASAIHQLNDELQRSGPDAKANQQVRLLLLKLAAGESDEGHLRINSSDPQFRKYWHHQLAALGLMLNEEAGEVNTVAAMAATKRRRATRAVEQLEEAQGNLAGIATMRLNQAEFASEVRGFGQFTPVQPNFQPGQQVLIYCEIQNYSLRQSDINGQLKQIAELQGQYSIVDSNNRVVFQHQYQPVKDVSQRRRKDFYMFFPMTVPTMSPGQYRMHMSVEDLVGNKIAGLQEDLVFNISTSSAMRAPSPQTAAAAPVASSDNLPRGLIGGNAPSNPTTNPPHNQTGQMDQTGQAGNQGNMPLPLNRIPGMNPNEIPGPPARTSDASGQSANNMPLPINGRQRPGNYQR